MQLKLFWHNIEQLQNKEVDIMSSNIENDANAVDILQLVGKWLTTQEKIRLLQKRKENRALKKDQRLVQGMTEIKIKLII